MKHIKNLPFHLRLLLAFLVVAAIPLIFSAFLMVRLLDVSLDRQSLREGRRQLAQMQTEFQQVAKDCASICEALNTETALPLSLLDNKTIADSHKDAYLSLYYAVQKMRSRLQFSVYDAGGRLRFTSATAEPPETSMPLHWGLLRQVPVSERRLVFSRTDPYLSDDPSVLMQAAYPLEIPDGARTGYLVMDFTRDSFDWLFSGYHSDKDILILTDQHRAPVYCSQPNLSRAQQTALLSGTSSRTARHLPTLWYQDPDTGFYLFLQKGAQLSPATLKSLQTTCLLLAIPCLGLCLAMSLLLSRSISQPVNTLDAAMKRVRNGDLSVRVRLGRQDELGRLGDSFNRMAGELQENIKAKVQRQKDLNETRLRLYQTQLNPHFLYNTLDTIKWNARIHQNPDIPVLAENLAIILRRSISAQPFVTLREELETIGNYMEIQKIRFSGRFLYETEVPDQLETCLVPKMILQPLVENAILHGLEGKDGGYICIFASQETRGQNQLLKIAVTDDGNGMGAEMTAWINSPDPPQRDGHLGLYNVIQILKLDYGQEYGLHAEVVPGEGTTVTITLPLKRRELSCTK